MTNEVYGGALLCSGEMSTISYIPATTFTFSCGDGEIVIDTTTGKVTLPEGMPLDKAAREFWLCLEKVYPEMFPKKEATQ